MFSKHRRPDDNKEEWAEEILHALEALDEKLEHLESNIMSTLDDAIAADVALKAEVDSIVALVATLNMTVATLTAEVGSLTQDPAKIDQLVSDLNAQAAEITAALPAPPPPVVPPAA